MKTVGFIGVGIMGKSMVRNLMKNGFQVSIYARHPEKVADVVAEGAVLYPTIAQAIEGRDAIITIVGYPADVEEVYLGENGIFAHARPGQYCVDMTTSSPTLAEQLHEKGKALGLKVMDCPVTGGDTGARNGTLSILCGGDKEDFEACLPLFRGMGTNINYQGKAGCGQHAKLANQIAIAGALSGVCEALAYAKAKGLDLDVLFQSIRTGAARSGQLDSLGPKIIQQDDSAGFFMKHFVKDMRLASGEAEASSLELDVLNLVLKNCIELEAAGNGEKGTQALRLHYAD